MSAATFAPGPSSAHSFAGAGAPRPAALRSRMAAAPGEYYQPVLDPSFPRTEYELLDSYVDPVNRPHSRMLWAARDASTEWTRACAEHDWDAIDEATVRLAVFDKAYELNQVQWPYRGWQEPQAWREETDAYADAALVYAARALRDAGGHIDRLPHRSHILAFCRAALDLCAEPLVDDGPVRPALLDKVPPPPAVPGDRIGSLLERYDPVVRHAQELAEPLERNTAVFIYDASCQEYVLQDEHGDEDENEVPDLTLDKSEGSPARARAGAHVPCSKGGDGSQPPRQMTPPTPPAVGTPTDVELASEGRPSLNDAPRAPSAARK